MNRGRPKRRAGWSRSLHRSLCVLFSCSITTLIPIISARAQRTPPPPIIGPPSSEARIARWDLTVSNGREKHPAWLEVERSGYQSLVGRFVGQIGGARPIGNIEWSDGVARFSIPSEWESNRPGAELRFEGRLEGDSLVGTIAMPGGTVAAFVGKRAPSLMRDTPKAWSPPVTLFNGKDLSGWTPAPTAGSLPNHWSVRDGALVNTQDYGVNLMTVERFQDFKLHAEFRLSKDGVAGIFPRGRYWVILSPKLDPEPFKGTTGAVHRFLVPNQNAGLGPDVWQAIDITLVGRRITVVVNAKPVIVDEIIPGITGSAIDSDEAAPGPIMLQGEERRVEFRNITISVPR